MAFTHDQAFERPDDGAADWDTALRSNFEIAEGGFRLKMRATTDIVTGRIVALNNSGWAVPYSAFSYDIMPFALSIHNVTSGEEGYFLRAGRVRSVATWSGHLVVGQPVFAAVASLGHPVSSLAGALRPVGHAIGVDAITFSPYNQILFATESAQLSVVVGSNHSFALPIGPRGTCRRLRVACSSLNAYRVLFHSGSARVASELLYETLTTSVDGAAADFDISTVTFTDAAMFPFQGTDAASPYLIFGQIRPQSASSVGSDTVIVTFFAERF